jgi:hypothetical protein
VCQGVILCEASDYTVVLVFPSFVRAMGRSRGEHMGGLHVWHEDNCMTLQLPRSLGAHSSQERKREKRFRLKCNLQ